MSNNNNNGSNNTNQNRVSGPTSALSSFLREHGISVPNASRRARRERMQQAQQNGVDDATLDTQTAAAAPEAGTQDTEMAESSTAAQNATSSMLYNPRSTQKTKKRLRKKGGEKDNDSDSDFDGDDDDNAAGPSSSSRRALPGRSRIVFCAKCKGRFARKNDEDSDSTICPACQAGPSTPKKQTRKKKIIPTIKKQVISTEALPSLQDCCIAVIAEYIDEVENFGDIADDSLEKLAKIISRNRKINDMTSKLFMQPFRKQLSLFDCTNMSDHGFYMISQFCPKLQYLQLIYCGQITDKSLRAYQERLHDLKSLEMSGPFLVTKEAWISFFETVGARLESFQVRHTARFVKECMEALATHCPNLKKLKFGQLSHFNSDWIPVIAKLKHLDTLELAWTSGENTMHTEDIVHLLSEVGSGLKDLSIKGGHELTDDILLQGILKHCHQIKRLNLEQCDQLTSPAMVEFLEQWQAKGLTHLDISSCTKFDDTVLEAVLRHSGKSLEYLNLHSLIELTAAHLELIAGNDADLTPCVSLTHLDCGFVRSMDDYVLMKLIKHCTSLRNIQVWGCHMLTESVPSKPGLRISGREMSVQYM
ncbi:rad7-like protein rhp7 [Mucor ambiguus]|uniref:Rad7-like protein rhp7 n=1 Tax=Mucor ambiguus TaxID=91626 RepID=A0A0C9MSN6_9FUNG|nr:rad7-like protein rhp7 [Mucor ambiguus]